MHNHLCRKLAIALATMYFLGLQAITPVLAVNITGISVKKAITTPVLVGFTLSTGTTVVPLTSAAPTVTAPTSASTGVITYTSSVPSVARIDLNTHVITLVGGGATVLTATQAPSASTAGNYTSATTTVSLTVLAGSMTATTPGLQTVSGTVGTPIASTSIFTTAGLAGIVSYTVSPALPTGLGIISNSGVISGTPTTAQASTTYTITATGATAGTASSTVSIAIVPYGTIWTGTTYSGGPAGVAGYTSITGPLTVAMTKSTNVQISIGTLQGVCQNLGTGWESVSAGRLVAFAATPSLVSQATSLGWDQGPLASNTQSFGAGGGYWYTINILTGQPVSVVQAATAPYTCMKQF